MNNDHHDIDPVLLAQVRGGNQQARAKYLGIQAAAAALAIPSVPASSPLFVVGSRRSNERTGHTPSPKVPRPARRNAQHNPRGSRR